MLARVLERAVEIPEAIRKGKEDAIKRMIKIDINEEGIYLTTLLECMVVG